MTTIRAAAACLYVVAMLVAVWGVAGFILAALIYPPVWPTFATFAVGAGVVALVCALVGGER